MNKLTLVLVLLMTANVSLASDRRGLSPKKVTQSFPGFALEVNASITKDDTLGLSLMLDGKEIEVPKEILEGIDSPQIETLAFASYSASGDQLDRNHLKNNGFEVTLFFGKGRSHGESHVTEVFVYPHLTLDFTSGEFSGQYFTVPKGNYENSWNTTSTIDGITKLIKTTRSVEFPALRYPNRWQTKEQIENAREAVKERSGRLFPEFIEPKIVDEIKSEKKSKSIKPKQRDGVSKPTRDPVK